MAIIDSKAGWRQWLGLAVLGLPTFLVTMDFSVLYLAVPHLTVDLVRPAWSSCGSWTSTAS